MSRKSKLTIEHLWSVFAEIESRENLVSWQVGKIFIWPLIRASLMREVAEKLGIGSRCHLAGGRKRAGCKQQGQQQQNQQLNDQDRKYRQTMEGQAVWRANIHLVFLKAELGRRHPEINNLAYFVPTKCAQSIGAVPPPFNCQVVISDYPLHVQLFQRMWASTPCNSSSEL